MALSSLIVRIGANTDDLNRDLARADRQVRQFGQGVTRVGRTVSRFGNAATQAAGSLSRLGGVLPGVTGNIGVLAGGLGTASIVIGETAVVSTLLTKAWRGLGAASVAVAASSAPAWLASLATPAGLAIVGIAALTATVWGLKKAWDALPGRRRQSVLEDYQKSIDKIDSMSVLKEQTRRLQQDFDRLTKQLEAERAKIRPVTLDVGGTLTTTSTGDPAKAGAIEKERLLVAKEMLAVGQRLQELMPTAAEAAKRAWEKFQEKMEDVGTAMQQAVDGARPFTASIGKAWDDALKAIERRLKNTVGLTMRQVNQLVAMKEALESITRVSVAAPLSLSESAKLIRPDHNLDAQRGLGRGLDPRMFLGAQMDFRPTKPSRWQTAKAEAMSGLVPRDEHGKVALPSLGQTVGGMLGGAGGGMVQAFAAFGPMAAILPVINGLLESLGPVLEMLLEPLVELGRIVGRMLAPIFKMLAPVIKLIADLLLQGLGPVIRAMTVGLSFLTEAIGWVIRAIGRLIDAIPGVSAKGLINTGQAMIDAARAARKNALANEYATEEINKFANALSNVPNVLNINALRHLVSGSVPGAGPKPGGPTGPGPGGTGTGKPMMSIGTVEIHVNGASDPVKTAEEIERVLERRVLRGGTSRLGLAFA